MNTMTAGTRTLGQLIDIVNSEGPVSPAMQAIISHAERLSAAARTNGRMLTELGELLIAVAL